MHKFVDLGADGEKVYLYKTPGGAKARQVLWGDFLNIDEAGSDEGWLKVIWGDPNAEHDTFFIKEEHTTDARPLEMIFLDVGQGDSCVMVSPERGADERIFLIDAGPGDHLDRYLSSRFRYRQDPFHFHAAVVTHPDYDHYGGFEQILAHPNCRIDHIYHNGILEQHEGNGMGPRLGRTERSGGHTYQVQLLETDAQLRAFYKDQGDFGRMPYPRLMREAIANGADARQFSMLSTAHGHTEDNKTWMPGFAPGDNKGYTIEVLGPVVEPDSDGRARLRRLESNDGKTKNGHSVLLKLTYGAFSVLFGGDLNRASEELILQHYAQMDDWPDDAVHRDFMVNAAAVRLGADVLKVCHHGSSDVTDEFLQAVNPSAYIVSSGDAEGHVHPRPDLLGRLGRNGRGFAPLILSTELQRSTREAEDDDLVTGINADAEALAGLDANDAAGTDLLQSIAHNAALLGKRNVEIYGAIHVKTDGNRLIAAFRVEAGSKTRLWHYYEYELGPNGILVATHEVRPGH